MRRGETETIGVEYYLSKISQGIIASLVALAAILAFNKNELWAQLCLYETMPAYQMDDGVKAFLKFSQYDFGLGDKNASAIFYDSQPNAAMAVAMYEDDESIAREYDEVLGVDDIVFQHETPGADTYDNFGKENFTIDDVGELRDLAALKSKFYIVDNRTGLSEDLFNVDKFLQADLVINEKAKGPKILVFHTHGNEKYADSAGQGDGVIGFGEALCGILNEKYGIETLHDTSSFDVINGQSHILGAYERMEPVIKKILADNPSVQVAIDVHRDGVDESVRLVSDVDGKPTAQLMFFNGLSKQYKEGELQDIKSLPNKHRETNLAFSFRMQMAANALYPGITRKVYLNAFRYSLHMLPKSLLVEVGAQTNVEEEALNAAEPLADILASVILK
ncbi:MAG: stage II sporulation protein P [Clostridiales bacterium]|jgi:stage II sporulation protein P|nr:stage II sporulation protein P [Clostridiales bacterium]